MGSKRTSLGLAQGCARYWHIQRELTLRPGVNTSTGQPLQHRHSLPDADLVSQEARTATSSDTCHQHQATSLHAADA